MVLQILIKTLYLSLGSLQNTIYYVNIIIIWCELYGAVKFLNVLYENRIIANLGG